jgi:hypothetical protein
MYWDPSAGTSRLNQGKWTYCTQKSLGREKYKGQEYIGCYGLKEANQLNLRRQDVGFKLWVSVFKIGLSLPGKDRYHHVTFCTEAAKNTQRNRVRGRF